MFTGIIESTGTITKIEKEGTNVHFTVKSPITNELKIDQSLALLFYFYSLSPLNLF